MEQYCTLYSEIFFPSPSILPTVQKCIISQKVVHISSLQMPVVVRWRFSSFTSTVSCSKCPWNLRKISGLEHSVPQSRHWHLQKTCRRTYIYMVSHTKAGKIVAVLLLWHLTNERTHAMQEKMKKNLQMLSSQYQIQELKQHGTREEKFPGKNEENRGTIKIKVKKTPE